MATYVVLPQFNHRALLQHPALDLCAYHYVRVSYACAAVDSALRRKMVQLTAMTV